MTTKRVRVWIQKFRDRDTLMLQWHDPLTGKRKSRSANTSDPQRAEDARGDLEAELNGADRAIYVDREPNHGELQDLTGSLPGLAVPGHCVYFIRELPAGPVKIGWTAGDPGGRLTALQCGTPRRLLLLASIPGGRELEARIHSVFRRSRVRGEWFEATPALFRFIGPFRH